jgi:hypothetical protein
MLHQDSPLSRVSDIIERELQRGEIDWDSLTPRCSAPGCSEQAECLVRWEQCDHFGETGTACEPCANATRTCPYCGTRGSMTILEAL